MTDIRASDADRDRVAAFLRDQAAEGRLTPEELEERVGRAYAAVTLGDLERLVRDLPRPQVQPRFHNPPRHRPGVVGLGIAALLACAVPGLVWAAFWTVFALGIALVVVVAALGFAFGPFLAVIALVVLALRRRRARWGPLGLR